MACPMVIIIPNTRTGKKANPLKKKKKNLLDSPTEEISHLVSLQQTAFQIK